MAKPEMLPVKSWASAANPNPKHASPLKVEGTNNIQNAKRVPAAKLLPHDAVGFPSAYTPEIRKGVKSVADSAPRQFPKSPLDSLYIKKQVKANEVNHVLVTVNVLGSSGGLRFLARCDDSVQKVIESVLKSYAREGRLPVVGQNTKQFELHSANSGCGQALDPFDIIGSLGTRNFLLCKKHECEPKEKEKVTTQSHLHHQKTNPRKNWLNSKCFGLGISSH